MNSNQIDFFDTGISVTQIDDSNFEKKKEECLNDLKLLKLYNVKLFTLYKKWQEIKECNYYRRYIAKDKIWMPENLDDEDITIRQINELEPSIVFVEDVLDENKRIIPNDIGLHGAELEYLWSMMRVFCSTAEYNQAPGRFIKFFIIDKKSKKILGMSSIASDVISMSERDEFIGWTQDDKLKFRMLRYSAIGTTIVPMQPFGFNFLGGKLIACMVTSKAVRDKWEEYYQNKLVGMTTTSLYGSYSMYNSLKWWKFVGNSKGKILIKPQEDVYKRWHDYIKRKYPNEYQKMMTQKEGIHGPVTGAKLRVLNMIYKELGVKLSEFYHDFCRGIYYSCFYENTKEFLCRKITEDKLVMKPLFKDDMKSILDWWKVKAIKRYKTLKDDKRMKKEYLFYDDLRTMNTFDEVKNKFYNEEET